MFWRMNLTWDSVPSGVLHIVPPPVPAAGAVEEQRHAFLRARGKEHRLIVAARWAAHVARAGERRVGPHVLQEKQCKLLHTTPCIHWRSHCHLICYISPITAKIACSQRMLLNRHICLALLTSRLVDKAYNTGTSECLVACNQESLQAPFAAKMQC